jgi:hypothetical protein
MLTDKQEETLKKLKAGEITASEKADFYYRLSGILKKDLEKIKDLSRLLDEIPEGNLKKIDLMEATTAAMELTEKLVKKLDPPQIRAKHTKNRYVGFSAVKSFQLGPFDDKYYYKDEDEKRELKSIGYSMIRDLTEKENTLVRNIMDHTNELRDLIEPKRIALDCTFEEFLSKKLPALIKEAKSKGVKYRIAPDQLDLTEPLEFDEVANVARLIKEGRIEEPPK